MEDKTAEPSLLIQPQSSIQVQDDEEEEEEEDLDPRLLLTKDQIQYFKNIFDQLDLLQKKKIPVVGVGFILRYLGLNPTKAEIQKHIDEIDPSHKGMIDFPSFLLPIARRINDEEPSHEPILEAFKVFEEEEEPDFVNVETIVDALKNLAEELDDIEIETFLKTADPKGTGKINYVELVEKIFGLNKPVKKKDKKGKKKDKKEKKAKKEKK